MMARKRTRPEIDPAVFAAIANWETRLGPPEIRNEVSAFCRDIVLQFRPDNVELARTTASTFAGYAVWAVENGWELDADLLLKPSSIDHYSQTVLDLDRGKRSMRSNLRRVSRGARPDLWPPRPERMSRDIPKSPYSNDEIRAYLRIAAAQSTALVRARLTAYICLVAGAGLRAEDVREWHGTDLEVHADRLVVVVSGKRARLVPVDPPFAEYLRQAAKEIGDSLLLGGKARSAPSNLMKRVRWGDAQPVDVDRLNATWWVRHLGPVRSLYAAAGITNSNRVSGLLLQMPEPSLEDLIRDLGDLRE